MKAASAVHVDGLGALASGDVMSTEPIGRLHSIWEVYFQRIPSQLGVPVPNLLGATEHVANCVGKIIEVWIRSGGLNPRDDFQSPDASTVAEGLNGISPVQFNAFLSYKPPWSSGISSHHISYISIYLYIYISIQSLSLYIYISLYHYLYTIYLYHIWSNHLTDSQIPERRNPFSATHESLFATHGLTSSSLLRWNPEAASAVTHQWLFIGGS